ncbi:MAG: hypothetical protein Q8R50_15080 [Sediminibacterium sp.]|nr:hypothetical protein [Sediminibacterium sp.]
MWELKKTGLIICCLLFVLKGSTQDSLARPLKIAVFAPVYLDSAFADDTYKLGKNNLPKYLLPGLDFYNGVMLAIDSLNAEQASLEVLFFDSKSVESPLQSIVNQPEFQDVSLIIASFNMRSEIKSLADFSLEKNIPLISATYPNDGGLIANPFFVLINPTIVTHLEAIYKFMQRYYPTENITVFRKKGTLEDMIQNTFSDLNKKTPGLPLNIKTIELTDSFTSSQVTGYLDSAKLNVIICGTLNENFGTNLTKALRSSNSYRVIAMGMPTWDGIKDISKDLEIVYTTPYNYSRTGKLSMKFTDNYRVKFAGRPSDMAFKGFEAMYHFGKLLLKYNKQLIQNLSGKEFRLFNDFDIRPVRSDKNSKFPDYLENKKLYFIRKTDGRITSVN